MSGQSKAVKRKYDTLADADSKVAGTLFDLLTEGIPFRQFQRDATKSTGHTSDHKTIKSEGTGPYEFGILDDLEEILRQANNTRLPSALLLKFRPTRNDPTIRYNNEAKIQGYVEALLQDILELLNFAERVSIEPENALSKVKYLGKGSNRADFWVVLTSTNRPIMVVEVKSPLDPDVLLNGRVRGQVWDYLLDVMSFFGQYHVIGVSSTLRETCFHWFPHSDAYVASTTLQPQAPAPELDMPQMAVDRELHSSALIDHTDTRLVPMLLTAIIKAMNSPHSPVPMIDVRRAYVRVSQEEWTWARITAAVANTLTFHVTEEAQDSDGFLVIKYFFRSSEKKVWLTLAEPSQQIVVAKIFATEPEARRERDLWELVNRVPEAFCTKVRESWAMCTPFAIHASEGADKTITFNFNVAEWARQSGANAGQPPASVAAFSTRLAALGSSWSVLGAAQHAIRKSAEAGVVHKDLAWRHIALLPVFDERGDVQRLEPVLLDFGRVEEGVDREAALAQMHKSLQEMLAGTK
jgi:hypothetical protein